MFKKLTPYEHHKSFMPFDYLFMTKEQYEEFVKKTQPVDAPINVTVAEQPTRQEDCGAAESSGTAHLALQAGKEINI